MTAFEPYYQDTRKTWAIRFNDDGLIRMLESAIIENEDDARKLADAMNYAYTKGTTAKRKPGPREKVVPTQIDVEIVPAGAEYQVRVFKREGRQEWQSVKELERTFMSEQEASDYVNKKLAKDKAYIIMNTTIIQAIG